MKCRDVMTKQVKTCKTDSTAKNALRIMHDWECGVVPVVDEHNKLAGIVTDRDIAIYTGQRDQRPAEILLNEFMTKPVLTCHANDHINTAIEKMKEYKIRRVPIVDDDNHVVGLISLGDVAVITHEEHETFEALEEISSPVSSKK